MCVYQTVPPQPEARAWSPSEPHESRAGVGVVGPKGARVTTRPHYALGKPISRSTVRRILSIVQRKVLDPNEFASLDEVDERLRLYEELSNGEPRPFRWKFNRMKLAAFLQRLEARRALSDVA
jgi:hypothetical protein